ncbi:J domain-containing protein [Halocatena pleomorpha]|uniref:J domain-containing protein n=1 Tax=Halocatena pleomorpha TaxID=1785090 RepID=A0A3P3RJG1_9EURY|nr:J domain-containing protein [Halocatena pleomorpha]RRJ33474.1 J domain-containing protein [Halocatena pleomorpha]
MSESYYELLGVEPDASRAEIETAYRETVKQVHPDKSEGADAEETFLQVQKAREVLTDPQQRAEYDRRRTATESETDDISEERSDHRRAHDGSSPDEQTDRQHRGRDDEQGRYRQRSRWTDRSDQRRSRSRRTSHSRTSGADRSHRLVWDEQRAMIVATIWKWGAMLLWVVRTVMTMVRCPRRLAVDRARLTEAATTPTGIRISATIVFVLGATIAASYAGFDIQASPTIGLVIVIVSLVGSYTGYDLLFPTPYYEPPTQQRYDPDGVQRLWPIVATNLLGIGLIMIALIGGAPTGGILFTGTVLVPVVVSLVFSDVVRPTLSSNHSAGVDHVLGALTRSVSLLPSVVIALLVFTRWGFDTPTVLEQSGMMTATPWFGRLTLSGVYVGVVLNLLVGVLVCVCLLWSLYAMCLHLTAAPWADRYSYGYQIRPGPWNLLVAGPFVIIGWMIIAGVPTIDIPVGISTITITQRGLLLAVFLLPSVLTGLYILRRRLEPMFHVR